MATYLYMRLNPKKPLPPAPGSVRTRANNIDGAWAYYADQLVNHDAPFRSEFPTITNVNQLSKTTDDWSKAAPQDTTGFTSLLGAIQSGDVVILYYLSHLSTEFPIMCTRLLALIAAADNVGARVVGWHSTIDTKTFKGQPSANMNAFGDNLASFKVALSMFGNMTTQAQNGVAKGDMKRTRRKDSVTPFQEDGADGGGNGGM